MKPKQLTLPLVVKPKRMTMTEMDKECQRGVITRKEFFKWVKEERDIAYEKGYRNGRSDGYAEGVATPKSHIPDNY